MALTGRESLQQSIVGLSSDAMSVPATPYNGPGYTQGQAQAECRQAIKRRRVRFPVSDAATAGTAVAEEALLFVQASLLNGIQIIGAWWLAQVAITEIG